MNNDLDLLREYARNQSEAAFATLVSRYVNLVYSVARRQVPDPHLAEEITQAVFIILARKAASLGDRTILPGWLCRTARYASANALTIQRRRQHREQEAYMQNILTGDGDATSPQIQEEAWQQITPLLDGAMDQLGQKDHDALVLRFFENKTFAEVGAGLGASEDAAKMRVNRALEKLRKVFSKHGIISTTAILAGTISANSVQAAPVGMAKSISLVAATKGATATASTLPLVKGTLNLMAWLKTKTVIVIASGTVLAGAAVLTWEQRVEKNIEQERTIRAEERQIRQKAQDANLSPAEKQALDNRLNQLQAKQNSLRAAQSHLLETSTNAFMRPSKQISPFTRVRFAGEKVLVTYLGKESELVAVNGQSTGDILAFCRDKYGDQDMYKRFAEDLVVVLSDMGHTAGDDNTVSLTLLDPTTGAKQDVAHAPMSAENRWAVFNALHPTAQSQLPELSTNAFMRLSLQVSPFTHVRFAGDKVFVMYLGNESELAAVNGQPTVDILAFCRAKYGEHDMYKRFAEDLVVVLSEMGHPAGDDNTVSLALLDPVTGAKQDVTHAPMSAENRRAVFNALHPAE